MIIVLYGGGARTSAEQPTENSYHFFWGGWSARSNSRAHAHAKGWDLEISNGWGYLLRWAQHLAPLLWYVFKDTFSLGIQHSIRKHAMTSSIRTLSDSTTGHKFTESPRWQNDGSSPNSWVASDFPENIRQRERRSSLGDERPSSTLSFAAWVGRNVGRGRCPI